MASPHVAGAAVLYLAGHPTAAQVQAAIVKNATAAAVRRPGLGMPNRLLHTGSF
ncbi:hypothetical protein ACFP2T_40320 [Plantactinospora solaniradicis]|uniref:Peptidase S8/S53 domain-containing protein n=1 Tax=Plantactinospora solaniradicis TaxID=1723736 RepID=A0ABW1KN56_9ACTN